MKKLMKYLPTKRKLMQLYFALLFNANLKGFVSGNIYQGSSKQICVPGINCYSCPGAVGACPLGSLQGSFSAHRSTWYYVGGILLLYSILFGRMICGWLCPFGLIQELLYKIKTPKLKKSPITRLLSYLKYVILIVFVFIIPICYAFKDTPMPAFCKYICPAGTIEGGLLLLSNKVNASYFSMLGPIFTWKFLLMVSIVVGCIFAFRFFCRFLCPLGALYGLFNKISVFGVHLEKSKCVDCGKCFAQCKVDIRHVGDQECVSCGECISVCPTQAISWKGPKILVKSNDIPASDGSTGKKKRITRAVVAVLMALHDHHVLRWKRLRQIIGVEHENAGPLYARQEHIVPAVQIQTHHRRPAAPQGAHDPAVGAEVHLAPRQIVGAYRQAPGFPEAVQPVGQEHHGRVGGAALAEEAVRAVGIEGV